MKQKGGAMDIQSLFQKIPTDLGQEHYEFSHHYAHNSMLGRISVEEITEEDDLFLTLTFPPSISLHPSEYGEAVEIISKQLKKLLPEKTKRPVLVIGLGNPRVTVDSFGHEVVKMITATAHLKKDGLCLYTPDVTENSGIPTIDAILSLVRCVTPRAVIVIDSLCARSSKRLGNTLQFSNTSISPGSGIRRSKMHLSKSTLGVPVVVIGMPTIVSTASLILETLSNTTDASLPNDVEQLINDHAFYVSPNDIDISILRAAALLGDAINLI